MPKNMLCSPYQRANPVLLHIGSIVDIIPFLLYPCGEVCNEETQELQTNTPHTNKWCTILQLLIIVSQHKWAFLLCAFSWCPEI